jgi:hypothetical protein
MLPTGIIGDIDVETSPREPRWPSVERLAASGKVGTRHLTLGLCLVTTRQAWTKLDSRDISGKADLVGLNIHDIALAQY